MEQTIFTPADILIPHGIDLCKWSVVACDQYTSEPEYWQHVEQFVGGAPSTLRMILPEVHLEDADVDTRIRAINSAMQEYIEKGIFEPLENSYLYIERVIESGKVRRGLIGKLDLECYDYSVSSQSPVRPTEGTVESRLPPRIHVRRDAPLELPHIMVLIDDVHRTVIEPIATQATHIRKVYDFELMEKGGTLRGWVLDKELSSAVDHALEKLFRAQQTQNGQAPVNIAVGDGNHSLATAKACWEALKKHLTAAEQESHPARFALVELENLHDEALEFEPIHRVLFDINTEQLLSQLKKNCQQGTGEQSFCCVTQSNVQTFAFTHPSSQLTVGSLQHFLDEYLTAFGGRIDYIHGVDVAKRLAQKPDAAAFLLPGIEKGQLFPSVQLDGALPRKTFSMGHAWEKRYYLETRRIK